MMLLSLHDAFLYRKKMASTYSFFDRGLIISSPFGPLYWVTSIMSQRSLFIHSSGNIFYEAIRMFTNGFPFLLKKCITRSDCTLRWGTYPQMNLKLWSYRRIT